MQTEPKDSRKVRVAMIGAGNMANDVHYPSLASLPDVEFAGICDLIPERLHATADKYGIEKRYTDYRRMLEDTTPEAVYAIGNPDVMYSVWIDLLERGHNLYIEKPMGITLHQADLLAYLAEQKGCITQVSFQRRSCPLVVMLREECLKRGPIVHAVCKFYKYNIAPYLQARDHMMDDSVHSIDTLRWICGGEVVEIESITRRVLVPDINFIGAMLHFDSGATGFLINSWTSGKRIFAVEMHAPGIYVEAEHEDKGVVYTDGSLEGKIYDTREVAGSQEKFIFGGFQAKHREFIDCLKSGRQPESNFADALKTMEVAEKILAAAILKGR